MPTTNSPLPTSPTPKPPEGIAAPEYDELAELGYLLAEELNRAVDNGHLPDLALNPRERDVLRYLHVNAHPDRVGAAAP